jgi:iron uptake system component EfeO
VLTAPPGTYLTACKPGMVGEGIRAPFTVSDSGEQLVAGDDKALVDQANAQYQAYVKDQTEQLLTGTEEFVAAYKAGSE